MKNLFFLITLIIGSISVSAQYQSHECYTDESMLPLPDPSRSTYVPYGGVHTPKGNLHGLVIFVGFNTIDNKNFHGDFNGWLHNDIPDWAKGG